MDRASRALAQIVPSDVRRNYYSIAKRSDVPRSTVWYRDHGRPSREAKAQGQQYLTPLEEKALIDYLLRMASLGSTVRIKFFTFASLQHSPPAVHNKRDPQTAEQELASGICEAPPGAQAENKQGSGIESL